MLFSADLTLKLMKLWTYQNKTPILTDAKWVGVQAAIDKGQ